MRPLDVAVEGAGVSVSLRGLIRKLHQSGTLVGLLRKALSEEFLVRSANDLGVVTTDVELQHAADLYRRRRGLRTAAATHRWLASRHLSPAQFEARIERWLLVEKLKDHVTASEIEAEFAKRRAEFDAVGMRQAIMPTQDAADEMAERLREGMDFSAAARLFASPSAMAKAFDVAIRCRREMPAGIAEKAFAADVGKTIGPIADAEGFSLYLVVSKSAASFDAKARAMLRDELFAKWLARRLDQPIRFPILDALESPVEVA